MVSPGDEFLAIGKNADVMSVGVHCAECRQLDYLPFTTPCSQKVCAGCKTQHLKDCKTCVELKASASRTLPTCPICDKAIKLPHTNSTTNPGDIPAIDMLMSQHINSGCTMHVASPKPKANRCHAKGCKTKLSIVSITCNECGHKYCPKHRFATDHSCDLEVRARNISTQQEPSLRLPGLAALQRAIRVR